MTSLLLSAGRLLSIFLGLSGLFSRRLLGGCRRLLSVALFGSEGGFRLDSRWTRVSRGDDLAVNVLSAGMGHAWNFARLLSSLLLHLRRLLTLIELLLLLVIVGIIVQLLLVVYVVLVVGLLLVAFHVTHHVVHLLLLERWQALGSPH